MIKFLIRLFRREPPKRLTLREAIAAHNEPYNPNVRHWTRGGCDDHE